MNPNNHQGPQGGNGNLILIGMPGAGKSTIGVVLAKRLGMGFVDTDLLIQMRCGRLLQEVIDNDGLETFRALEEQTLKDFDVCNAVIATGGSAVYSAEAMAHLSSIGTLIFIDVPLAELQVRLRDMATRGLSSIPVSPWPTFTNSDSPSTESMPSSPSTSAVEISNRLSRRSARSMANCEPLRANL